MPESVAGLQAAHHAAQDGAAVHAGVPLAQGVRGHHSHAIRQQLLQQQQQQSGEGEGEGKRKGEGKGKGANASWQQSTQWFAQEPKASLD